MEVRSSLSKRLMAWSKDLYMAADMRCVMSLFKSIDLPNSWMADSGREGRWQEGERGGGYPKYAQILNNQMQHLDRKLDSNYKGHYWDKRDCI